MGSWRPQVTRMVLGDTSSSGCRTYAAPGLKLKACSCHSAIFLAQLHGQHLDSWFLETNPRHWLADSLPPARAFSALHFQSCLRTFTTPGSPLSRSVPLTELLPALASPGCLFPAMNPGSAGPWWELGSRTSGGSSDWLGQSFRAIWCQQPPRFLLHAGPGALSLSQSGHLSPWWPLASFQPLALLPGPWGRGSGWAQRVGGSWSTPMTPRTQSSQILHFPKAHARGVTVRPQGPASVLQGPATRKGCRGGRAEALGTAPALQPLLLAGVQLAGAAESGEASSRNCVTSLPPHCHRSTPP